MTFTSSRSLRTLLGLSLFGLVIACGGEKSNSADAAPDKDVNKATSDRANQPAASEADLAAALETAQQAGEDAANLASSNLAASEKFLAENAAKDNVTTLPSGLQYQIVERGVEGGATPTIGDMIQVHYTGSLMDGTIFDSSRERGAAARFPLQQGLILGWLEGLPLMKEGDRFIFTIPPAMGYGETGTPGGPIGPNQALVFDVQLLNVLNAEKNLALSNAYFSENAKKEGVKSTESGLQYKVINRGDGQDKPTNSDKVKVHFRSLLIDDTVFNDTYTRGQPTVLPVNTEIAGLSEGLRLMSPGDKYRLFIPPSLGYGEQGAPRGPIGPNEAMIFEVELIDIVSVGKNLAAANAFLEANASKQGIKTTPSGLQYKILNKSDSNTTPTSDDKVRVHYRGTLTDGTQFDSSYDRGKPSEFRVSGVIAGWTEGLQLMSEGDKFEFYIPPALGYGERGTPSGSIGPNNALVFEVELLKVITADPQ